MNNRAEYSQTNDNKAKSGGNNQGGADHQSKKPMIAGNKSTINTRGK